MAALSERRAYKPGPGGKVIDGALVHEPRGFQRKAIVIDEIPVPETQRILPKEGRFEIDGVIPFIDGYKKNPAWIEIHSVRL